MAELVVSMQAYCKILLHAAKYPHCAVNGVLLAEDSKSKDHKTLRFVDCIPLFHLSLGLSPMLEAALLQIEAYCKSMGYIIAGYYQANEHLLNVDLNNIAKIIGKKIHDNFPEACIFMVDNQKVSALSVSEVYRIYTFKDTSWKELDKRHTVTEETLEAARSLLTSGDYRHITDFDNHFDDLAQDWRNLSINDVINRCT
ncbi:hypothetical protein KUTeg_019351 [Tegillarca granosa]|uniref:MPN domain-containing protein n=1 Tax=Tegillarca granosa TaxID=220873 RepID=A0ABQ9EHP8_TEGGR|nr:hypothetical protein KUTeg_019351 [Tegillarca granosa]